MEAESVTQKRQSRPSRRLLDPSNAAEQEVVAHRQTVIPSTAVENESADKTPAAPSAKRDAATAFAVPEGHSVAASSTGSSPASRPMLCSNDMIMRTNILHSSLSVRPKPKKVARTADSASQDAPDAAEAVPGGLSSTSSTSSRIGPAGPPAGVARPSQGSVLVPGP